MNDISRGEPVIFSPALACDDACANYWMRQVTFRLRREICWRWHEHGATGAPDPAVLPPPADRLLDSLDMTRYAEAKRTFFATDVTARYLSEQLIAEFPEGKGEPTRGSFSWVVSTLKLDPVSTFTLALALSGCFDNAVGPVIAACLNDPSKTQPTLALAQKLWDQPEAVLSLADPSHPLWRYGLLQQIGYTGQPGLVIDWDSPLAMAPLVANQLLFAGMPLPQVFAPLEARGVLPDAASPLIRRLKAAPASALRIVPVCGPKGSCYEEAVHGIASAAGREVYRLDIEPAFLDNPFYLRTLVIVAWLKGVDLFFPEYLSTHPMDDRHHPYAYLAALRSIPTMIFLGLNEPGELARLPRDLLYPLLEVPGLSYSERVDCWNRGLGNKARGLEQAIAECARRFRYEKQAIYNICAGLAAQREHLTAADLVAACQAEVPLDAGELAQKVIPRFGEHELILPPSQRLQFEEIYRAMKSLTEVHYGWGTARALNESGISVLFAGLPGTGKTMAAEILAVKLNMPMYRIDLSQVVNKYIGETEKNLKRLFDMADTADTILFFDEADALFGRRTEVRDAHDRYANLEISYLLERMERFKGLAILATNRRKDLDEAFLRRLRYIIEFPLPDAPQRKAIWKQVIPENVDTSLLDFDFLARQFQLTGGHIRSIVFNACLQTADGSWQGNARPQLTMDRLLVAVKREYDKLKRSVSLEQFGRYAPLMEDITHD